MFKKIKCTINHKTNKQAIEYRVYSDECTFKTCAPRAWLALTLEDRTTDEDLSDANALLIFSKIGNQINKCVDLNIKVKAYADEGLSRDEAYLAFAIQNDIVQYEKRNGRVTLAI